LDLDPGAAACGRLHLSVAAPLIDRCIVAAQMELRRTTCAA
jgi:hypothetical protein